GQSGEPRVIALGLALDRLAPLALALGLLPRALRLLGVRGGRGLRLRGGQRRFLFPVGLGPLGGFLARRRFGPGENLGGARGRGGPARGPPAVPVPPHRPPRRPPTAPCPRGPP